MRSKKKENKSRNQFFGVIKDVMDFYDIQLSRLKKN
jgi:hypothetical protein